VFAGAAQFCLRFAGPLPVIFPALLRLLYPQAVAVANKESDFKSWGYETLAQYMQ
jgi:hypothetical protein